MRLLPTTSRLPWLVLAAGVSLFWWLRIVVTGTRPSMLTLDMWTFFYPTYHMLFARVARGELPLWNPYQLCGVPALGSPQGGLFYPPHLLYLVLPHHVALAALGLLHLLLLALSTALFVRRVGGAPAAATLAALLFALRGAVLAWLLAPPLIESAAWLPLGCVAIVELVRRPRARPVALLAAVMAASWLAGGPQATVYVLYVWTTLVPAMLIAERGSPARWVKVASIYSGAIALGTLAAGIQLAPSMEMAAQGTRALARLDGSAILMFGGSRLGLLDYVGQETIGNGSRYSLLALALVVAAPFLRRRRALACWGVVVGVFAMILSLGPATPVFRAYDFLPALAWFRNPPHLLFITDFCFAVAAAIVLGDLWPRASSGAPDEAPSPLARGVVAAAAATLLVGRLRWQVPMPIIVAAAVLVCLAAPRRARGLAAGGLVFLCVLDVVLAPPITAALPFRRAAAMQYRAADDVYAKLREMQGAERVWIVRGPLIAAELSPKLASFHRVRLVDDYESISLRRQADYYTYLLEGTLRPRRGRLIFAGSLTGGIATASVEQLPKHRRLLDLLGVKLVLLPAGLAATPAMRQLVGALGLRPLPSPRSDYLLFENPQAVPRAFVVYHSEPAPAPAVLLARLADPRFDPLATSYVEGTPPATDAAAPARGHPATFLRDEEEVVEVEATLAAPGLLVLADSYYPGWRAYVDGVATDVLPTDHLFRGVPVPAGTHRVRFEYHAHGVVVGAAASGLGLLVIGILTFRRSRDDGP